MANYDNLDRETLLRLLKRRDAEQSLGLVWERDDIEVEGALNNDFVALTLDCAQSHGEAPWENLIIEGDNFDALRALKISHKSSINCIYIDPPYNTGNRDFVYNDRFVDANHRFRHSLWLEFMHKRLILARDLLSDDGVILVSIDDNEVFRLGMLMDRVFGEDNKVGTIVWKNVTDNNPSRVVKEHEYILVYSRKIDCCAPVWKSADLAVKSLILNKQAELLSAGISGPQLQAEYTAWFRTVKDQLAPLDNYKFIDEGGVYAGSRSVHNPGKEGYRYDVIHPKTGLPCKQPLMGYRFPEETMQSLIESDRILFGDDETKLIELKIYVADYKHKLSSVIDLDGRSGANEVRSIFGGEKVFNNPKPVQLLADIFSYVTKSDDVVLDFFAGSGTTAHALEKLNRADGGRRKFILVSSTEATDEAPEKNLCRDVCAERVRRIQAGYLNARGDQVEGLGGGFGYMRARRIPMHRLTQKIDHAEIWNALQMLHRHALTPWAGGGFAVDEGGGASSAFAYLSDAYPASRTRMEDWLAHRGEQGATIYTWSPERYRTASSPHDWQAIPQHLRERFGR